MLKHLNVSMKKGKIRDEIIGWIGAFLIIAAYIALSFNFIDSNGLWYQGANVLGAFGMIYISFKKRNYQPGMINIIWAIVALIAIYKIFF